MRAEVVVALSAGVRRHSDLIFIVYLLVAIQGCIVKLGSNAISLSRSISSWYV